MYWVCFNYKFDSDEIWIPSYAETDASSGLFSPAELKFEGVYSGDMLNYQAPIDERNIAGLPPMNLTYDTDRWILTRGNYGLIGSSATDSAFVSSCYFFF